PEPVMTLYRPVGRAELGLIRQAKFRDFPARLPQQPYFYPVVSEAYATQIARDWNTKDEQSGFAGYVLRFQISAQFLESYPVRTVGDREHSEYWIPAADLARLNEHLVGEIAVIAEFHGCQ